MLFLCLRLFRPDLVFLFLFLALSPFLGFFLFFSFPFPFFPFFFCPPFLVFLLLFVFLALLPFCFPFFPLLFPPWPLFPFFAGSALLTFLTAALSQLRAELPLSMTEGTLETSSSVSFSSTSLFLLELKSPFQLAHLSMLSSNSAFSPAPNPAKSPLIAPGLRFPAPSTQPIFL